MPSRGVQQFEGNIAEVAPHIVRGDFVDPIYYVNPNGVTEGAIARFFNGETDGTPGVSLEGVHSGVAIRNLTENMTEEVAVALQEDGPDTAIIDVVPRVPKGGHEVSFSWQLEPLK